MAMSVESHALQMLSDAFAYRFRDPTALTQALTHQSIKGETNNERLEFLGDAALESAVSHLLYRMTPTLSEGLMASVRGNLVNTQTLCIVGLRLGLIDHVRFAPSVPEAARRNKLLADALEAVIALISIESGEQAVQATCEHIFAPELRTIREHPETFGRPPAKTRLQGYLQKRRFPLPQYNLVTYRSDPVRPYFRVQCDVGMGLYRAEGEGHTLLEAEQNAASCLIASQNWDGIAITPA